MNGCDPKKKKYKAFVKKEKSVEPMNVPVSPGVQYTVITQELDFVSEN